MQTHPDANGHVVLALLSQARYLGVARGAVHAFARQLGFDDACSSHITLAVDEAVCNVIRHGYEGREDGAIWLRLVPVSEHGQTAGIEIVIEDEARQIDPGAIKGRDLENVRPGGLGVHIIREVMEGVVFEPRPGKGMRLTMRRYLPSFGGGVGISARPQPTSENEPKPQAAPASARHKGGNT